MTTPGRDTTSPARRRTRDVTGTALLCGFVAFLVAVCVVHLAAYYGYRHTIGFSGTPVSRAAASGQAIALAGLAVHLLVRHSLETQKAVLAGEVALIGCSWWLLWTVPALSETSVSSFLYASATACNVAAAAAMSVRRLRRDQRDALARHPAGRD